MAEYWSNNDRGYRIKLTIDQIGQNVETNTSSVRIRLSLFNTNRTFSRRQCKWYVDGFGQYTGDVNYFEVSNQNSELRIVDKTITVDHKNGNSYNVKAFFYGYGNADSPYDLNIGPTNVVLDSIDNVSTFELPSNVVVGETINIQIAKRVPSAKHAIRCAWFKPAELIADNVDNLYKWTIPDDYASSIPNASSGWGTIYLDTYINGKLAGTQSKTFTASLSLNKVKPTFSRIALADVNEKIHNIIQSEKHFVSILSKIYARFDNVEAKYGATITRYFMEIAENNNTISAPNGTFREISVNKDTQFTLRGYVEDSRGIRSDPYETTITVLNYFSPTLKFEVTRSGSKSDTLTIKRFAKIAPLSVNGVQKNTMKLTFTTTKVGTSNVVADNGQAGGEWSSISEFKASNANLGNSYPADTSYIVVGKLEDKFTSISFQATVPSDRIVMSYDKEGIGINKYRERGALDVDGLIYSNRKQIQHHKLTEPNGAAMDTKVDNLNDYRTTGFYSILGNYRNHPASGEGAYLGVVESISGYHQTLTTVSGRMFKRTVTNNSNGSWIEYTPKPEKQEPALVKQELELDWGMKLALSRKGNMVSVSLIRGTYKTLPCENLLLSKQIPQGFKPCNEAHLLINQNASNTHKGVAVLNISPTGEIRFNNQFGETLVYAGSVSYITEDN